MSLSFSISSTAIALACTAVLATAQDPAEATQEQQPSQEKDLWIQDFSKAKKLAADTNRPMLVDFTGSDWCGWCIRLDEEVFSQEAFKEFANEALVLVKLDYPRDKSILPEGIEEQNEKLQIEYTIEGYPTIMLMDAQGRPFAKTGYQEGGPGPYVDSLKEMLGKLEQRNEHMAAAQAAEGVEKAKHIKSALEVVGDDFAGAHYGAQIEAMLKADPENTLDAAEHYKTVLEEAKAARENRIKQAQLQKVAQALSEKLGPLMQNDDHAGALKAIDAYEAEHKPEGLGKQVCVFFRGIVTIESGDMVAGRKLLLEAQKMDKDGPLGMQISQMLQQLPADVPAGGGAGGGDGK